MEKQFNAFDPKYGGFFGLLRSVGMILAAMLKLTGALLMVAVMLFAFFGIVMATFAVFASL